MSTYRFYKIPFYLWNMPEIPMPNTFQIYLVTWFQMFVEVNSSLGTLFEYVFCSLSAFF